MQIDALIAWRHSMEAQLTGARAHGPNAAQLSAIDGNFQQMRENLLAEMRGGLGTLRDSGQLADARMAELVEHGRQAGLALQTRVEAVRRTFIED